MCRFAKCGLSLRWRFLPMSIRRYLSGFFLGSALRQRLSSCSHVPFIPQQNSLLILNDLRHSDGEFSKRAKDEEEFRKSYEDGDGRKQGDDRVEFVPHALQRIGFVSMRQVFKEISNATSESPKPRVYFTDEGAYVDVTKFQSLDRDVGSAAAPDIPTSLQSYRKLGFSDDTIRAVGSDPESSPAVLCTIYNCYQKKETYAHVTFNSLGMKCGSAVYILRLGNLTNSAQPLATTMQ